MNKTQHYEQTLLYFQDVAKTRQGFYDIEHRAATKVQIWVRDTLFGMIDSDVG
jgi:hypothetical protein